MDDYPADLAPHIDEPRIWKEGFQSWWHRVGGSFANVPKNVARQWLHRHWGASPYRFLPTAGADFRLEIWTCEQFEQVQLWRYAANEVIAQGRHLLRIAPGPYAPYRLAKIMARRGSWPAPIIVLEHDGRFLHEMPDLPIGRVLIEGHRRTEIARALAADGLLTNRLSVWVLSYD